MPLITVVTAAKNAASFIEATIDSIREQTLRDFAHVIVDDGSTDATPQLVEAAAARDKRIELVRLDHTIGPYAAANLVMLQASSKYLARIDADDIAAPHRLDAQIASLAANPGCAASTGAWQMLRGDTLDAAIRPVPSHSNGVIKWMMWFRSNLIHSTLLVSTEWFQRFGGYGPELVGEDYRVWGALVRENALAVTDETLVQYRFSDGQMTASAGSRDQPARHRITLDHMEQCGGDWSFEDARDIRWVGEAGDVSLARAYELLDRFEAAWRADRSLSDDDRAELATHTARRRLRHLSLAVRRLNPQVAFAAMRCSPSSAGAFARVLTNRGIRWP